MNLLDKLTIIHLLFVKLSNQTFIDRTQIFFFFNQNRTQILECRTCAVKKRSYFVIYF